MEKKLKSLLKESVSYFDKSFGNIFIRNPEKWIIANEILSKFLTKQGVPINCWQIDRILRKIANDCLISIRSAKIDNLYTPQTDVSEMQRVLQELPIPEDLIVDKIFLLFTEQPYKFKFFIPLLQNVDGNRPIKISDKISLIPHKGLTVDFLKYIKRKQLSHRPVCEDYGIEEDTFNFGSIHNPSVHKKIRSVKLNPETRVTPRTYLAVEHEGLIFIPIKYEPELSVLRSKLRQLLALMELTEALDSQLFFENDSNNEIRNLLILQNESVKFNKFEAIEAFLDEIQIFNSLLLNSNFFAASRNSNVYPILDDTSETHIQILNALEWYGIGIIKSFQGADETFEYISYMTAIEALLGSKKPEPSMMEKLADRTAFLLGGPINKRSDVRDKFISLYTFRSHLLHGRRNYQNWDDSEKMKELKQMTKAVLLEELKNESGIRV